jgi:hypothetical protein
MDATLSLHGSSLSAEDIAELARRLRKNITDETGLTARPFAEPTFCLAFYLEQVNRFFGY